MNTHEKLSVGTAGCLQSPVASPDWQAEPLEAVGVDVKAGKAGAIRGYVVALAGSFKTLGRGRFTEKSLREIQRLWPRDGLPVHAQHGDFLDDKLLAFLGRSVRPALSRAIRIDSGGGRQFVPAVRADLLFDEAARATPGGDLVEYFTKRIESDPGSLSSSFVLNADAVPELDSRGRPIRDSDGNVLPPIWTPTKLWASDLVSVGDAVDSLLGLTANPEDGLRILRQDARKQQAAIRAADDLADRQRRQAERKRQVVALAPYDANHDPEVVRRQINARRREWTATEGVVGAPLNGCRPTDAAVDGVRRELSGVPFGLRHELFRRGARVEVIDAVRTTEHPSYRGRPGESLAGFAHGKLAVVNARYVANTPLAAMHEYGHLVDTCLSLSGTVRWQYVFDNHGSDDDAAEAFAESFAMYYHGPETRNKLSLRTRQYFDNLQQRFEPKPLADAVA